MAKPQKLGAKAKVTRLDSGQHSVLRNHSAPPGHPARGRVCCRGRSPGSRVDAAVRPSRNLCEVSVTSLDSGSPLTVAGAAPALAYAAPASLLAPGNFPGEPRRAHLPATGHDSQRTVSNISASTGSAGESSFKRGQNRFQLLMYPPAAVPGLGKSVGDWRQSPPQNPFRRIRFSR